MDLTRGVAVRLSALCLDDRGRLAEFDLWDMAVRGALLVDLALAGRVQHEDDSVVVDPTPTGFAPADALLAPMAVEPEQPLDWWLDSAAVDIDDLARDNVAAGRWGLRRRLVGRRYVVHDEAMVIADLARDPQSPGDDWDAATAALMAIADAAGVLQLPPRQPAEATLAATGELRWLCQAVADRLDAVHALFRGTVGIA